MPGNKVQITIEALNNFQQAFEQFRSQIGQVDASVKNVNSSLGLANVSSGNLLKGFVALWAAKQVFDAIKASIQPPIEYLAKMETSALGIAASFLASGEYIDDTTGKALKGQAALTEAQEETKRVLQDMQIANFETIATLDQLVRAYQETLPIAMAKGFNKQQVKEYTVAVVQAAGALGVQLDMLGEETRSMLTGAINPRTSRIATALGITNEDIKAMEGDANRLFEFLTSRLEGFRIAGVASQSTWNGLWSNMKDMALMVGSQALEPLFEMTKRALTDIQKKIVDVDEATGKVKGFSSEFMESIKTARVVVGYLAADLIGIGATFDIAGTKIGEQITKMAYRVAHPIEALTGTEQFPQSAVDEKTAYYADLIDTALGRNQKTEQKASTSTTYRTNAHKPDPDAAEKAAKLEVSWNKTARDLSTDLSQVNTNEFDNKIADYENKATDLKEKFKAVKGAAAVIDDWLAGMKANEISKYEKKNNEEILKLSTEAAQKKYEVYSESEKFITERTMTEHTRRLQAEDEACNALVAKLAGQLAVYNITEEEYDAKATEIREASQKKKLEVTEDYNRQILEAMTNHELAMLDAAESNMSMPLSEITLKRISTLNTLLDTYNSELQRTIENGDTLARMGWQDKIDSTNKSLIEQNKLLKEQTGTFEEGLLDAIKQYGYNMQTEFQFGKQAVEDTASALQSSFASSLNKLTSGDTQDFIDYIGDFCNSILEKWNDMLATMITNWIMTGDSMKSYSSSSSDLGGLGGILASLLGSGGTTSADSTDTFMSTSQSALSGFSYLQGIQLHSGGLPGDVPRTYRLVPSHIFDHAPRYHSGIGPDEDAAIIQKSEGVFTGGQMKALGLLARKGQEQQDVTSAQVVSISISAVDAKSFEQMCSRNPAALVQVVNKALKDNNLGIRDSIRKVL